MFKSDNSLNLRDVVRKCENEQEFIIYGAASIANILYIYLENIGLADKISYFVVSEMNTNRKYLHGKKIFEYNSVKDKLNNSLIIIATQNIISGDIRRFLLDNGCSKVLNIDSDGIVEALYNREYRNKIENDKVLVLNMNGNGFGCNPKYIVEELIKRENRNLDIVWAVSENNYKFPDYVRHVKIGSKEFYHEVATAKVLINNTRMTSDIRKRHGQFYLQTWHGAAPIKKVEADVEDKLPSYYINNAKKDSNMADLVISGSEFYTNLYKTKFWYDGEILKSGLPRQDILFRSNDVVNKVRGFYKIKPEYKIVLYAPTFRNEFSNKAYDLDIDNVVSELEIKFGSKFICFVSKHPNNINVDYCFTTKNYIDVCKYDDFEEILATADVLITDYSGCMYDFSFTGRPIFLYQPDYDDYLFERDFYISMDELPYSRAKSNIELVNKIESFDFEIYKAKLEAFMKEQKNYDDGHASEKVADYILNNWINV